MAKTRARWQSGTTIKDVATHAGVSPMTVSRVLNNEPVVKPATRSRVMEAVKELNYRPNFSARSLAKARSFFIGLLYDNPSAGYVSEFLDGAVRRCRADRYHMVLENCSEAGEEGGDLITETLSQANVDGVIILPPVSNNPSVIQAVENLGLPFVRIAPDGEENDAPAVGINDYEAAYQMTRHLIELGHSQIGFIKGHPNQGSSHERYRGFTDAMAAAGLTVDRASVAQGYFDFRSGIEATEALLSGADRPTAIFASNDDMAAAAITMARKFDLEVPEDLSVVGFDDTPIAGTTWPALTTVRQPIAEMAEAAVGVLIRDLKGDTDAPVQKRWLLDCTIVERDSSAKPKPS